MGVPGCLLVWRHQQKLTMKLFPLILSISLALSAPRPQEYAEDGVEPIGMDDSQIIDNRNEKRRPIVIVIRPTDFLPKMPKLPELPPPPNLNNFPHIPHPLDVFERDDSAHPFELFSQNENRHPFDFFGQILDETRNAPHPFDIFRDVLEEPPKMPNIQLPELFPPQQHKNKPCGFLCTFLGSVATTLDGGIKSVFGNDGQGNHTYDEKVLSDGSVLRVNRSTFQNTDKDGNGFFFQTSLHHVVSDDNFSDEIETIADVERTKETSKQSILEEDSDDVEGIENEDIEDNNTEEDVFPLNKEVNFNKEETVDIVEEGPEMKPSELFALDGVNEEENEIDVDMKIPTLSVSGIDDGLFQ